MPDPHIALSAGTPKKTVRRLATSAAIGPILHAGTASRQRHQDLCENNFMDTELLLLVLFGITMLLVWATGNMFA